jgi:hypothetical protein
VGVRSNEIHTNVKETCILHQSNQIQAEACNHFFLTHGNGEQPLCRLLG